MLNNVKAVMTTMSKQGFQLFLASFFIGNAAKGGGPVMTFKY